MRFNSKEEREEVIIKNIDLVTTLSAHYSKKTEVDIRELEGYGYEGLLKAIDRYDDINPQQNFRNYLYINVKRSIIRGTNFINNYYKYINDTLNEHKEDLVFKESNLTLQMEYNEWANSLNKHLTNKLSRKELTVINKYYGLNGETSKDFNTIGKEEGYSKQFAHKIKQRALYKLSKSIDSYKEALHDIIEEPTYVKKKKRK